MADTRTVQRESLWKLSDYRWWFFGDSAAAFGGGLRSFATPLIALTVTGSATFAGVMSSAVALAMVVGIFYGGLLADKVNKRTSMLSAALVCVLAYLLISLLAFMGILNGWVLLILLVTGVTAYGLTSPVSDATLRSIVPTKEYPQALAINDGRDSALEVTGAPVGGLLYGLAPAWPFVVAAIATALNGLSFLKLRADLDPHPATASETTPEPKSESETQAAPRSATTKIAEHFKEASAGITFILRTPMVRVLAIGSLLLNIGFSGIFQTLIFDWHAAERSALIISLLPVALAVGTIAGAFIAGPLTKRYTTGLLLTIAFTWAALTLGLVAFFTAPWQVIVLLAMTGLVLPLANAAGLGFMVTASGADMQGRVISAQTVLGMAATPLALIYAGFSFDQFGTHTTLITMAVPLAIAVIYIVSHRRLRSIPRADQWDEFLSQQR